MTEPCEILESSGGGPMLQSMESMCVSTVPKEDARDRRPMELTGEKAIGSHSGSDEDPMFELIEIKSVLQLKSPENCSSKEPVARALEKLSSGNEISSTCCIQMRVLYRENSSETRSLKSMR